MITHGLACRRDICPKKVPYAVSFVSLLDPHAVVLIFPAQKYLYKRKGQFRLLRTSKGPLLDALASPYTPILFSLRQIWR